MFVMFANGGMRALVIKCKIPHQGITPQPMTLTNFVNGLSSFVNCSVGE